MTFTIVISMIVLSFSMSITPGPVNMLIITSGVNFGFKKTFAFVSGATIGFTLLLIFIAMGFINILDKYPLFLTILSKVGALFIIYMGYKILMVNSFENVANKKDMKTLKFSEGFLLQWLNPKAWIACVAGVSMFSSTILHLSTFIIIYFFLCYVALSFWAIFGEKASLFLKDDKKLKIFNLIMGLFLILPAAYLLIWY